MDVNNNSDELITREVEAGRRKVRLGYHELKQKIDSTNFHQLTDLTDVIKEADELLDVVEREKMTAREAVLDANVFKRIAIKCRDQAQGMSSNEVEFLPIEYATKLANLLLGNHDENGHPTEKHWKDFGKNNQWVFQRTTPLRYLFGSVKMIGEKDAVEQSEPKTPSKSRPKPKPSRPEKATQVTASNQKPNQDGDSKGTEQYVEQIFDIIKEKYKKNRNQPICYYSLVTHPQSFSATVKSMFYLSFLVKDRRVTLWFDENDIPHVYPVDEDDDDEDRRYIGTDNGESRSTQVGQIIMSIDKKRWERIIDAFDVQEAMIMRDNDEEED